MPLAQKLAGKPAAERQQILREECHHEIWRRAVKTYGVHYSGNRVDVQRMTALCNTLYQGLEGKIDVATQVALTEKCRKEATSSNSDDVRRMSALCDAMIGEMGGHGGR